jgi:hypothetical protein
MRAVARSPAAKRLKERGSARIAATTGFGGAAGGVSERVHAARSTGPAPSTTIRGADVMKRRDGGMKGIPAEAGEFIASRAGRGPDGVKLI